MVSILLVVNLVLNTILVSIYGLIGAALATTITGFLGVLIAGIYIYNRFHSLTNLLSLFRILVASSIIYLCARVFPVAGTPLLAYYAGLLAIYFALLFLFRETREEDIQVVRDLFSGLFKSRGHPV